MSLQNSSGEIYISFNQTEKYDCVGTSIGFYIYSLNPFKKILSRKIDSGISIVKMLYESNIIVFVGKSDKGLYPNNKLIIWDDSKKTVLGEITYNSKIINLNVTKDHIIVLIKGKIYVYDFESLDLLRTIKLNIDTKLICMGLENSEYLIYPGDDLGTINITTLIDSNQIDSIQAHQSNIENLCISNDGKYIASASEKGTVIRLFSTETKEKINEFRRGCDPTKIIDLRFNHTNSILLVSSVKGTIHLYNSGIDKTLEIHNPSYDSYGMYYVKWALPQYFSDYFSFLQFNIPDISSYSTFDKTKQIIYSFGQDGQYYELNYSDMENPKINKTIKYISDENDPFADRSSTIK